MFTVAELPANMQSKITVDGGCWTWTGAKNNRGYGSTSAGSKGKSMLAHRRAYAVTKGEIPEGYEIDHLCENRPCVNPAHLEAVTPEEHRSRIGHKDLEPLYPSVHIPSPEVDAAFATFFRNIDAYKERYAAMSLPERAQEDARRHRLHVATGTQCRCELAS